MPRFIYSFFRGRDWDYMSFRLWIGAWIFLILLVLVAVDASALVCYITRFTEENFATLIAFIFIYKAVENVIKIGVKYPIETVGGAAANVCFCEPPKVESSLSVNLNWTLLSIEDCKVSSILIQNLQNKCKCFLTPSSFFQNNNGTLVGHGCPGQGYVPDVFLMSILLFLGTFLISVQLKDFKNALFFPSKVSLQKISKAKEKLILRYVIYFFEIFLAGEAIHKRLRRNHSHFLDVPYRLVRWNQNAKTSSAERLQTHIRGQGLANSSIRKEPDLVVGGSRSTRPIGHHIDIYGSANYGCYC